MATFFQAVNRVPRAPQVFVYGGNEATIRNCSFDSNRAQAGQAFGGAIKEFLRVAADTSAIVDGAAKTLQVYDSTFYNNSAELDGGALSIDVGFDLYISNSMFAANTARAGGAIHTSSISRAMILASNFIGNQALSGAGGALLTVGTEEVHLVDCNLTNNQAATHGGAVRSEARATLYPRGVTHFTTNDAEENGGAISLDASALKTNEAALLFAGNEARFGGAISLVNDASANISAGCQTVTFGMNWAESLTLAYASPSVFVRRIRNTPTATPAQPISSQDLMDERGDWTVLTLSSTTDSSISMCLAPGEYEMGGSEGGYCYEGWGGGYMQVVDLMGSELTSRFTVDRTDCTATTTLAVPKDAALTNCPGLVRFQGNRAEDSGGAFHINESCSADLGRVDFARNSAIADGGALFVDALGDLSLSQSKLRNNDAKRNGGAAHVNTFAKTKITKVTAGYNRAGRSGGMLHLSGVAATTLWGLDATGNQAGASGGAVAVTDSTRTVITLTNSTIRQNKATDAGGGLYLKYSEMEVAGVQLLENSADPGNGGAALTSGEDTLLRFSDTKCVGVDVLLDWSTAGNGCLATAAAWGYTCEVMVNYYRATCADLEASLFGPGVCSGCDCSDGCVSHYKIKRMITPLNNVFCGMRCRTVGIYDKFFVIQQGADTSSNRNVEWSAASVDLNGAAMRGLPFAGAIQRTSFCAAPGEYTMHAIDEGGHGWWGDAFYSVLVNGETVRREKMNSTSSSKQSATFLVALPVSARTMFSDNKAPQGGGGAVFLEDDGQQPESIESYRYESDSNAALYGSFAATPARTLEATRKRSYNATSGKSMVDDPITLELKDGCV